MKKSSLLILIMLAVPVAASEAPEDEARALVAALVPATDTVDLAPSEALLLLAGPVEGAEALDDAPHAAELATLLVALATGDDTEVARAAMAYAAVATGASVSAGGVSASASASVSVAVPGGVNATHSHGISHPPVTVGHLPLLSISLGCSNDIYTDDVQFLIDQCGNDLYLNNAGGNGGADCTTQFAAAALVDLGGNDVYGNASAPRDCGVNGGGHLGSGLLVDLGGDDAYHAGSRGTNGGGFGLPSSGALYDLGGNDAYHAGDHATNGGALHQGVGTLVDLSGDDTYRAGGTATNGGALSAVARLIDGSGVDDYEAVLDGAGGAAGTGVNGGSMGTGTALLADLDGTGDRYAEDMAGAGDPLVVAFDATVMFKGGMAAHQIDA